METFSIELPTGEWALIADGDAFSVVGIQIDSEGEAAIAIADASPAANSNDWFRLSRPVGESVALELPAGKKLFGRNLTPKLTALIRGYRKSVA